MFGKGENYLPTIDITNLARVVRRITDENIAKVYMFAIDGTPQVTSKCFTHVFSGSDDGGKIEAFAPKPAGIFNNDWIIDEDVSERGKDEEWNLVKKRL